MSRGVEIKNACNSYRRAVQDLSRGVHSKGILMDRGSCREAIEQPESNLDGSSSYQEAIENAIKSN